MASPLFLGLDLSTQGLQATVINRDLKVEHAESVNFDRDLPEFETEGGVHHHPDGVSVTSPALMWVAALDLVLDCMRSTAFPGRIVALSGSGQQHGSVWLAEGSLERLQNLDASGTLRDQLASAFSVGDSPIWMDSSTGRQCREREEALGGAQAVADLTGSRAYERFTGNQIAKIYRLQPGAYAETRRIALVSSFMASLLIGADAPIDASDGSGMNLMDLRSKAWSPAALDCTAPGLAPRLGEIVPSHAVIGRIHRYYCERFGFNANGAVVAFSGDNPNSLAGLQLQQPGDVAVSLGTSDTMFGFLSDPKPSADEGHIFANPVAPEAYMALVCYKNGSLTREEIRDTCAGGRWEAFSAMLNDTPVGNVGSIGFFIKEPEITPPIIKTGIYRFDRAGRAVASWPAETDVRAVIEGQFLSMKRHGESIGLQPRRLFATGGASSNEGIIQVMADVFGAPVYGMEQTGSAALGAAYRALHGWQCARKGAFVPFSETMAAAPMLKKISEPDPGAHEIYREMLERHAELEWGLMDAV